MKIRTITAALLLGASFSAQAVPVTYNFTATWSFEADAGGVPTTPTTPGDLTNFVFLPTDTLSGSFVFDNEAPLLVAVPGGGALYSSAITNFSAAIRDYNLVAPTASAFAGGNLRALLFSGATNALIIDDWTSASFSLHWNNYTSASLPSSLPPLAPSLATLSLSLIHNETAVRRQVAFGSVVVSQVPEPGSLSLMALGALMLSFGVRRRITCA